MAVPGFRTHPKFKRLLAILKVPEAHALGYLHMLWETGYNTADPYIGDALDVEIAAGWVGDSGVLCEALLECGGSDKFGFIEESPDSPGKYQIHDLFDHAPQYVTKRAEKNAKRRAQGVTISDLRRAAGIKGAEARKANGQANAKETKQVTSHLLDVCQDFEANGSPESANCCLSFPSLSFPSLSGTSEEDKSSSCEDREEGESAKPKRAVKVGRRKLSVTLAGEDGYYFQRAWDTFPTEYRGAGGVRNLRRDSTQVHKLWVAILKGAFADFLDGEPATAEELAGAAQYYMENSKEVKSGYACMISVFYSVSTNVDSKNRWVDWVRVIRKHRAEGVLMPPRPLDEGPILISAMQPQTIQ